MAEPITLTVGAIATLAFTKFLESSSSEAAKKLTPLALEKMGALTKKIWAKLRGIPEVDALRVTVEKDGKVTNSQIELLTPYLEAAMRADDGFAQEVRQLVSEINQEINIGEILGTNIQNVYGGSAVQVNDPSAPTFTGDISGGTFNFTFNK